MLLGIQKRQCVLVVLALSFPLLLNVIGMFQDVGVGTVGHLLIGNYPYLPYHQNPFGLWSNPLPQVLRTLMLTNIPLGLLMWIVVSLSNKRFFSKQPILAKVCEGTLIAWLVAVVVDQVTGFLMPLAWLPLFHDTLGLPGSDFVMSWSHRLILPITTLMLGLAILLPVPSETHEVETTA